MENFKQQIEQLRKQIEQLRKQIDQLEQEMNKPKIEVGKVYRIDFDKRKDFNFILGIVTKIIDDRIYYFGFNEEGNYKKDWVSYNSAEKIREATTEEWTTALTRYCDELYKDCDRVDRTGLEKELIEGTFKVIDEFFNFSAEVLFEGNFQYKGLFVMDKHGKFAKGLKAEPKEMYVNIYDNAVERYLGSEVYTSLQKAKDESTPVNVKCIGTFKLVPVD
jgi:hypothetical protein